MTQKQYLALLVQLDALRAIADGIDDGFQKTHIERCEGIIRSIVEDIPVRGVREW